MDYAVFKIECHQSNWTIKMENQRYQSVYVSQSFSIHYLNVEQIFSAPDLHQNNLKNIEVPKK